MQAIKYIFGGCLLLWLLTVASCALLGTGTVMMVDGIANSDAARKVSKKVREEELREHNDRANRERSVHERDDYQADYYDNY